MYCRANNSLFLRQESSVYSNETPKNYELFIAADGNRHDSLLSVIARHYFFSLFWGILSWLPSSFLTYMC